MAQPFPLEWGRRGSEGVVVEFTAGDGARWVGNFEPGMTQLDGIFIHPDGRRVLVAAHGDLWSVDIDARRAELMLSGAVEIWAVDEPAGMIVNRYGLAFLRLGAEGTIWSTRRLSFDGFRDVVLEGTTLSGSAYSPFDSRWEPFSLDIATGAATGGSFGGDDHEGWERLSNG